ncbi:hypothetical protein [Streptomyces sp. NBC_01233]|uniref:hypothetical protein n=1 Tax=Streptomyces sp. NBC_01233 TaxID=2903787 RepID=UPI003FA35BA1
MGGAPLDPESVLDSLALREGEALYLRARDEALPDVHLDDLVDGISTAMQDQSHGWNADASRRLLHGLAAATMMLGLVALALPGAAGWIRAIGAATAGLLGLESSRIRTLPAQLLSMLPTGPDLTPESASLSLGEARVTLRCS